MNEELIKAMPETDLSRFVVMAQTELAARARKRKEDTIAKIKELAGAAGVSISIKGARGRPPAKVTQAKARASALK